VTDVSVAQRTIEKLSELAIARGKALTSIDDKQGRADELWRPPHHALRLQDDPHR